MSIEKQTPRSIAPEDHTAGSNGEAPQIKLNVEEIAGWLSAVEKQLHNATKPEDIDTLSLTREELRAMLAIGNRLTEGMGAGMANIPLDALLGKTKEGDPDHVPSIDLLAPKS